MRGECNGFCQDEINTDKGTKIIQCFEMAMLHLLILHKREMQVVVRLGLEQAPPNYEDKTTGNHLSHLQGHPTHQRLLPAHAPNCNSRVCHSKQCNSNATVYERPRPKNYCSNHTSVNECMSNGNKARFRMRRRSAEYVIRTAGGGKWQGEPRAVGVMR